MTETASTEDTSVTFHVKSANNAKYTVTLPLSSTTSELKEKLSSPEYANVAVESQRLIYSGRVLKDSDTLASHKVKDGNTMHLVKSAASNQRQNPASQSTTSASNPASAPQASGVPTNIAAGTGNNPLAGLTGARYAGFAQLPGAGMFGPDGGMGPPPSQDQIVDMLSNPQVAQMMNEALQNPQLVDMMIQQNPHLQAMGPQARQFLQSEHFRQMITNPQALQQILRMRSMFGMGSDPSGVGDSAFPAPGVTNTTPGQNRDAMTTPPPSGTTAANPFAAFLGGGTGGAGGADNPFQGLLNPAVMNAFRPPPQNPSSPSTTSSPNAPNNPQNPFGMLFNPAIMGGQQQQGTNSSPNANAPATPYPLQNNPLFNDPALMNSFMQAMGGANAGGAGGSTGPDGAANPFQNLFGGFGGPGGFGAAAAPADTRPPEERYATQLRQLNEMGFFDFDRNIQALSRSGGDVNGALEWLFNQPSL